MGSEMCIRDSSYGGFIIFDCCFTIFGGFNDFHVSIKIQDFSSNVSSCILFRARRRTGCLARNDFPMSDACFGRQPVFSNYHVYIPAQLVRGFCAQRPSGQGVVTSAFPSPPRYTCLQTYLAYCRSVQGNLINYQGLVSSGPVQRNNQDQSDE